MLHRLHEDQQVHLPMSSEGYERLTIELDLLATMYPGQIEYTTKGRELSFATDGGDFRLRIPDGYLKDALPEVLSASISRRDSRNRLKQQIAELSTGEEILDSIIGEFNDLIEEATASHLSTDATHFAPSSETNDNTKTTIIVWLHHLLNTNKRKQCLSPPSPGISGVTKPGYPGVLIYSGPAKIVHEHVNELKGLNWAAFQVRLEEDEEWRFKHGKGVIEVESMGDAVAEIDIESGRKANFLEAMKMK